MTATTRKVIKVVRTAENWLGDMAWKPDSSTNDDVDVADVADDEQDGVDDEV